MNVASLDLCQRLYELSGWEEVQFVYPDGQKNAAYFSFAGSDGHYYPMFLTDFDAMMLSGGLQGDKITGTWTFVKRGQNYGVRLVKRAV